MSRDTQRHPRVAHRRGAAPLALLALGALASVPALAQPGDGEPRKPRPPVDVALDADGDETIEASELANAATALRALDANGDGALTRDELRPKRPAGEGSSANATPPPRPPGTPGAAGTEGQRPRRPLPPTIVAIDANADGTLDAGEIAAAATALRALDANHDGALSPPEYRPPRPEGRGQGGPQ